MEHLQQDKPDQGLVEDGVVVVVVGQGDRVVVQVQLGSEESHWVGWHYQTKAAAVHYTSLKDGSLKTRRWGEGDTEAVWGNSFKCCDAVGFLGCPW